MKDEVNGGVSCIFLVFLNFVLIIKSDPSVTRTEESGIFVNGDNLNNYTHVMKVKHYDIFNVFRLGIL